jgi:hypothetical protein
MIANAVMFAALVWSGYKAFTANTKDDALMIMIFVVIPIVLTICGVQFDPTWNDN